MKTKQFILNHLRKHGVIRTRDIVRAFRISRQTAHQHLQELIVAKKLIKEGSTLSARYIPFSPGKAAAFKSPQIVLVPDLHRLEEDRVFEQVVHVLGLKKRLSPAAFKAVQYAFTEMLNNAIDHSGAKKARIEAHFEQGVFTFKILDRGIGAFESVRKKFKLKDAFEAAEHLLKGKQTTAPERHSGQGIFFTSRIADHFILESATLRLDVDNLLQDVAFTDIRSVKGTKVLFSLKQKSRKDLKKIFDAYTDSDFAFDRTEVKVRLFRPAGGYVSRSEARRLLFGLEGFKKIRIDFSKVPSVGQGFADEIFRVFQRQHPGIGIEPVHMAPAVAHMVKRAKKT